jgi:hypothetical protein
LNYTIRLHIELIHRLSAVGSTQSLRWSHITEEFYGEELIEGIYQVDSPPHSGGRKDRGLDVIIGNLH